MISLETIRQQLDAASGVELQMSTLVTMLYRWSKRYNTRALNMCERVRQEGFPFLYNDEAATFKTYALNHLRRIKVHYQRQVPKYLTLYCRKPKKSTKQ